MTTKTKLKVDDVSTSTKKPRKPRSDAGKNRMQSADRVNPKTPKEEMADRFSSLEPIPEEAKRDPVEWASKYGESLIPHSMKELEWQLKFGDAKSRKEIALEMLAFKGISNRGPNVGQVVPAIQLIVNTTNGLLPFQSEEVKKLPETIDATPMNNNEKFK